MGTILTWSRANHPPVPARKASKPFTTKTDMSCIPRSSNTDGAELIRRAREGDVEAFVELVQPCERAIFLAALSLVKGSSHAEDVAQEAVFVAFKTLSHFRQEEAFGTWLIRIVINQAMMKLGDRGRRPSCSVNTKELGIDSDYTPKLFMDWREIHIDALDRKEFRVSLVNAIDTLPEESRAVLFLRDILHLTIEETASVLELSETCVKKRLAHGRLRTRDTVALKHCQWESPGNDSGLRGG